MTSRRGSSARWHARQAQDPYVRGARAEGLRSRAAYKLLELDARDRLLRPGARVLDLGAAPGGWSQVAAAAVGPSGRVLAVDRLDMAPVPGVDILTGDFTADAVRAEIPARLGGSADLVLSDMAPNLGGIRDVDEAAWLELATLALEVARTVLKQNGALVVKAFQGRAAQEFGLALREAGVQAQVRKPPASRDESRELYFVARGDWRRGASVTVTDPGQPGSGAVHKGQMP